MSSTLLPHEREAVARASRHLASTGLVIGTAGNVSARKGDLVAVTPTGANLADVTARRSRSSTSRARWSRGTSHPRLRGAPAHRDLRGDQRRGDHARPRADLGRRRLLPRRAAGLALRVPGPGRRPPARRPTRASAPASWPTTSSRPSRGENAALMQNHGSVAYGSTMDQAIERLELLEWLSKLYWRASSIGTPTAS